MSRWLILVASFVIHAAPASAWDSMCLDAGAECRGGPTSATGAWRGVRGIHSDEHRQIFARTVQRAGLPASLLSPRVVRVPTNGIDQRVVASIDAVEFLERRFAVDELAQLPDFSLSLLDYANGNEGCLLPGFEDIPAEECHEFTTFMGAVNSNHFVPQSRTWYRHYHARALERAAECSFLSERVADDTEGNAVVLACEQEALAIEAVGQHYLQDAWATGHMWPRWGSPDLADFGGLSAARIVGAVSGMIHGAKGLQETIQAKIGPAGGLVVVDDDLNAPPPDERQAVPEWRQADVAAPFEGGLGDLFWSTIDNDDSDPQFSRLMQCATAGVLDVYRATQQRHGRASSSALIDPTSTLCFGQRVTNIGLLQALGLDLLVAEAPVAFALTSETVTQVLVANTLCEGCSDYEIDRIQNRLRDELSSVALAVEESAREDPLGTTLADGGLPPLLGVENNAAYDVIASWADPAFPWSPDDDSTRPLATLFFDAHVEDWCAVIGVGGSDDVTALRTGCIAGDNVACELCERFAPWVVQDLDGDGPAAAPSLCTTFGFAAIDVSADVDEARVDVAARWCSEEEEEVPGCGPGGGIGCSVGGTMHRTVCRDSECITSWRCRCSGNGCRPDGPFVVLDESNRPIPGVSEMTCRSD